MKIKKLQGLGAKQKYIFHSNTQPMVLKRSSSIETSFIKLIHMLALV